MFLRNNRFPSLSYFKRKKYTLPDLPYDYNALEPIISAEIMKIHHQNHHATYISNLNEAFDSFEDARIKNDLVKQVTLQSKINFNGGGNINHSIFWKNLCPLKNAHRKPSGPLAEAIEVSFGSFEDFKNHFNSKTAAIQGSGWGWLGFNQISGKVQFSTTTNQDLLQATSNLVPLLGIDVWEHAYYLQYKNVRSEYLKSIWDIINWDDVSQRFHEASIIKK